MEEEEEGEKMQANPAYQPIEMLSYVQATREQVRQCTKLHWSKCTQQYSACVDAFITANTLFYVYIYIYIYIYI